MVCKIKIELMKHHVQILDENKFGNRIRLVTNLSLCFGSGELRSETERTQRRWLHQDRLRSCLVSVRAEKALSRENLFGSCFVYTKTSVKNGERPISSEKIE